MRAHAVVVCLNDTTGLNFNGQDISCLGAAELRAQRGRYLHSTYALSKERVGRGVLDAWIGATAFWNADGHRGGIKESTRWIEGYERLAKLAAEVPGTRWWYTCPIDRRISIR